MKDGTLPYTRFSDSLNSTSPCSNTWKTRALSRSIWPSWYIQARGRHSMFPGSRTPTLGRNRDRHWIGSRPSGHRLQRLQPCHQYDGSCDKTRAPLGTHLRPCDSDDHLTYLRGSEAGLTLLGSVDHRAETRTRIVRSYLVYLSLSYEHASRTFRKLGSTLGSLWREWSPQCKYEQPIRLCLELRGHTRHSKTWIAILATLSPLRLLPFQHQPQLLASFSLVISKSYVLKQWVLL